MLVNCAIQSLVALVYKKKKGEKREKISEVSDMFYVNVFHSHASYGIY